MEKGAVQINNIKTEEKSLWYNLSQISQLEISTEEDEALHRRSGWDTLKLKNRKSPGSNGLNLELINMKDYC
jgi:hypothetical protein